MTVLCVAGTMTIQCQDFLLLGMLGLSEDWLNQLDIRGKRKMLMQDIPNVVLNLIELEREKYPLGFKVARLQNE